MRIPKAPTTGPPSEGGGRAKSPKSNKKPWVTARSYSTPTTENTLLGMDFFFLIPAETQEERGDFQNANLGGI